MTINDYLTFGISIVAIVISIIAYVQNIRIEKRQLRIEKLEEMLEITHLLKGNYEYFEDSNFFKNQLFAENTHSEGV